MSIRLQSEVNGVAITIEATWLGKDVNISISGGEGHIGAVALAQPRPSLADPARTSASTSVVTLCGHKEDRLACEVAEQAAIALNAVVAVACGIHITEATAEQINDIVADVKKNVEQLLYLLKESRQVVIEK